MPGDDTRLLVVTGSISCQLQNLGSQIFQDSGQIDGSTGTNTLCVVALPKKTMNTSDGKRQASL